MTLSRVRVAIGLIAVAAGTAWAVGGVRALGDAALFVLQIVPWYLIVLGAVGLLRSFAPRAPIAGPIILLTGGSVALAVQFGVVTAGMLNGVVPVSLIVGGVVVAMSRRSRVNPLATIVARHWSVFRRHQIEPVVGAAPHKFIVRCLFGDICLDLRKATYPPVLGRITVDITIFAGWVELRVPPDWEVHPGRLDLVRAVHFDGELSSSARVPDVPAGSEWGRKMFVLNVQGWGGRMTVSRGQLPEPPSPDPGSAGSPSP